MDTDSVLKKFNEALVPGKSKMIYEHYYTKYVSWCQEKKLEPSLEDSACLYLQEMSSNKKATTLWTWYSAIKNQLLVKAGVDATSWKRTVAFLKRIGEGEKKKKAKVFTRAQVNAFLLSDETAFSVRDKLVFLIGVFGALRSEELAAMMFSDIDKIDEESLRITVRTSKTDKAGNGFQFFAVSTKTINIVSLLEAYKSKVVNPEPETRLFRREMKDGFGQAVLGKNFFYEFPKKIATFLNLSEADLYTGHSIRRTAATWLADEGFTTLQMQRFGRWKSQTVAQGYVEESSVSKRDFANAICQENHSVKIQKTESSANAKLYFSNCVFNQVSFNLKSDNNENF
jgi:integrase